MCDNVMKQFPATVTIPTPMHTPRVRGVQAHGPHALGVLGENIRVRVNAVDHADIVVLCEMLGMTTSEFMRWCAVEVARRLLNK